jgi:enolase
VNVHLDSGLTGTASVPSGASTGTNPKIITQAIVDKSCNAAVIKLKQIGTVSETEDSFMADFTVVMGAVRSKPDLLTAPSA